MPEDFFDEIIAAAALDGRRRGVRVPPEVWEEFRKPAAAPPSRPAAAPEKPKRSPAPPPVAAAPVDVPRETPLPDNWEALREMVSRCEKCRLAATRRNPVFGEGAQNADLMFIGEGPGAEEDATGRPFVGDAGQLLDKMIAAMRFRREEVYIANVVKCRPPGNRVPQDDEAAECLGYLRRQIELVRPQVIVLLGGTALRFLLGKEGIRRHRGIWCEYRGIPVMPTYHPAYLLRQNAAKRDVWNDLKQVMRRFGKL